jgi:hypothetical protein
MYKTVLAVLLAAGTVMAICQAVNPSKNEGGQAAAGSPSGGGPAPANNAAPASDPANANANAKSAPSINSNKIPSGSKLFVAPMGGFENYVIAGILKKKVAVTIVADRDKAEYEIRGSAETEKAGWAKMLFLGSQNSNEQASVNVSEIKTGNVVFAYSVNKLNSVHGKQSAGEAIGKHLNEAMGKD